MAQLRGGQQLWSSSAVAAAAVSKFAAIGVDPYVAIFISNEGGVNATFDVQVAGTANPKAGRNALDGSGSGGLTWFPYVTGTGLVVVAGAQLCFDLSPFAPQILRLLRSDGGASTTVTAFVASCG